MLPVETTNSNMILCFVETIMLVTLDPGLAHTATC